MSKITKRSTDIRDYFLKDINPVVRFLILSDVVVVSAIGMLAPIFAIFVEDFIVGGDESVAGIAVGIYLFSRSILQIPVAHLVDKVKGEKDDFWFLVAGSLLVALIPLSYLLISTPGQLFAVQFFLGLFAAFTFPSYMAIFTRHIDKGKEGTEWGIYYTLTDLSSAGLAVIGGFIAVSYGFQALILLVVGLSIVGVLMLLPIRPYLK